MGRLIEMIRQSAVPAGVMRSAARGALAVPAGEMLEILVYLSEHPVFGEQARMTLASFDEAGSATALADPNTPREVLDYFLAVKNRRPRLLPSLFSNPAVGEDTLAAIAETATPEIIALLLSTPRVVASATILTYLLKNPSLVAEERTRISEILSRLGVNVSANLGAATEVEV